MRLRWSERGGPAIPRPPRPGLGIDLIAGLVEREIGGTVRIDFRAEGACYDITFDAGADADTGR